MNACVHLKSEQILFGMIWPTFNCTFYLKKVIFFVFVQQIYMRNHLALWWISDPVHSNYKLISSNWKITNGSMLNEQASSDQVMDDKCKCVGGESPRRSMPNLIGQVKVVGGSNLGQPLWKCKVSEFMFSMEMLLWRDHENLLAQNNIRIIFPTI